ncbi:hypothetical protein T484DRAFT_1883466 [Baffinella frigidus]|nr:hypothetical protein T484DRAFT_1883466 [Cryptophyta sp. CCMP2293]|mmetsp:Transcript_6223/g.15115  ORF Transcript_6223/g.15115 Transcript_6223/m.15115 type:complete len:212 (+) Transcript_6223:142-777(+)
MCGSGMFRRSTTSGARVVLFFALCVGASDALTPFGLRVAYKGLLKSHPTLTHVAQGAGVVGTGDFGSQLWVNRNKQGAGMVDGGRVARTCWTGVLFNGILMPKYYTMIQSAIPGRSLPSTALKVAIDALIWGAAGNFSVIVIRRMLEGSKAGEAASYAKNIIGPVFKADLVVWSAFNFGLYGVIPPGYQPACTALMSAAWSAYISTMAFDH